MKNRIQLQRLTQSTNSLNEVENEWETVATRWAAVEPLSAREQAVAKQINAFIQYKVTLRSFPQLKMTWQFLYEGNTLGIESIVDDDGMMVCLCTARESGMLNLLANPTGGMSIGGGGDVE